jgi:hypothetical protein
VEVIEQKGVKMQQPPIDSPGAVGSELRADAQHMGSSAANFLHGEADTRKGAAAEQARSASSAIQRVAGELDEGAPAWLKSTFQQSADQIQKFADALEQKDSRQLLNEVQTFARERPGAFLGACAAAGFAAARIFKAGGENTSSPNQQSNRASEPNYSAGDAEPQFRSSSPGELV